LSSGKLLFFFYLLLVKTLGNENEGTSNFPFFPFAFSLRDS